MSYKPKHLDNSRALIKQDFSNQEYTHQIGDLRNVINRKRQLSQNSDLRVFLNRQSTDLRKILIQSKVTLKPYDLRYYLTFKMFKNSAKHIRDI